MKVSGYRSFMKVYNESFLVAWLPSVEFNLWAAIYTSEKQRYNYWESRKSLDQRFLCSSLLLRDAADSTSYCWGIPCRQYLLLLRDSFCHFLTLFLFEFCHLFLNFYFWEILSDALYHWVYEFCIIEPLCQSF